MADKTLKVAIVAYEGLWVSSIIIFVDVNLALRLLILQAEIARRMTQPFPFKNVFEKELFFPSLKKFSSKVVIFELKTCMLKSSFKVFWNYFLKWNWIFAWANWPPFRRGSNCNRLVQVYSLRFYISQVINQFGWFIASSHLIDNFVKLQVVLYKVNQQKRVIVCIQHNPIRQSSFVVHFQIEIKITLELCDYLCWSWYSCYQMRIQWVNP